MDRFYQFSLMGARKIIAKKILHSLDIPNRICNANTASKIIYDRLMDKNPCMITRFGSTEIDAITSYIGYKYHKNDILGFITGKSPSWWNFNLEHLKYMKINSGFFPLELNLLEKFSELILRDIPEIDILGSWRFEENYLRKFYSQNIECISLLLLEPFWGEKPWSRALEDKKVLIIHPFTELIIQQYRKRTHLFKKKDILPDFDLKTIKAVQSIENCNDFQTWFHALKYMEDEIDKIDYDICLIGAGAYGMPLAAHAKRNGKKAIHLGGSLQLLFGIRGKRWDNPNYGIATLKGPNKYIDLFNEYWTYPGDEYKPQNSHCCDDNCYWK